jgi:hypothetical protein
MLNLKTYLKNKKTIKKEKLEGIEKYYQLDIEKLPKKSLKKMLMIN